MNKFTFLIPVFNDWNSLNILLDQIDNEISNFEEEFNFIIIDDKSSSENSISKKKYKKINLIKIIHLNKNLGSQRALAIGLKYIYVKEKKTNIILMDADGEDDPKALKKIISYSKEFPEKIITVNRTKRNESLIFRFMYEIHYFFTFLITGQKIRFGNYTLLRSEKLEKLFLNGDLWGAYPSAIKNNFDNIKPLYYERKKRYVDNTKMNFKNLIAHSLRIISIFRLKVFLFSIIYIIFFSSVYYFYESFLFLLPIIFLFIFNILIYFLSKKNKKQYLDNYQEFINTIEII